MGGYDKNPGSFGAATWIGVLVVAAAGFGGWKLYQRRALGDGNAKLECSLRIDTLQADCYATFLKLPAGDPTDVRIEFDGQTLAEPAQFDWAYLAPLDSREGPAPKADEPPPLGRQLRWRMPLKLVQELTPSIGDFIVHAKLFWAGRPQDMARFSTKVVFAPK